MKKVVSGTDDSNMVGENFHNFDYESTDPIQNLDILFIVFSILLITPIIFKLIELLARCSDSATRIIHRFKTTVLYWNTYIRFLLEAFLELSIACLLRVKAIRIGTTDDKILTAYAIVILLLLSVFMVGSPFYLTKQHKEIKK